MIEVTEELYAASIPKECSHRTIQEHLDMMLCWGLTASIEQGKKMNCSECSENLTNYALMMSRQERKRNEVQSPEAR